MKKAPFALPVVPIVESKEERIKRTQHPRVLLITPSLHQAIARFTATVGSPVYHPGGFRDMLGWVDLIADRRYHDAWTALSKSFLDDITPDMADDLLSQMKKDVVTQIIKLVVKKLPHECKKLVSTNVRRQCNSSSSGTTVMTLFESHLKRVTKEAGKKTEDSHRGPPGMSIASLLTDNTSRHAGNSGAGSSSRHLSRQGESAGGSNPSRHAGNSGAGSSSRHPSRQAGSGGASNSSRHAGSAGIAYPSRHTGSAGASNLSRHAGSADNTHTSPHAGSVGATHASRHAGSSGAGHSSRLPTARLPTLSQFDEQIRQFKENAERTRGKSK